METLSNSELKKINGGHDGAAYKAGRAVGHAIEVAGAVLGLVAFFTAKG